MSRYKIVKYRHIYGSSQNMTQVIGASDRIKEARGITKTQFLSELEMIFKHEMYADDYDICEHNFSYTDTNMFVVFSVIEGEMSHSQWLVVLKIYYREFTKDKNDYLKRIVSMRQEDYPQKAEEELALFIAEYKEHGINVYNSSYEILEPWA